MVLGAKAVSCVLARVAFPPLPPPHPNLTVGSGRPPGVIQRCDDVECLTRAPFRLDQLRFKPWHLLV